MIDRQKAVITIIVVLVIILIVVIILTTLKRNSQSPQEPTPNPIPPLVCQEEAPGVPTITSVYSSMPRTATLEWNPVPSATSYIVYRYTSDPTQGAQAAEARQVTSTSETFSNLTTPQQYFQVASKYSCAVSAKSTPESLVINCKLEITEEMLDIEYCVGPDCNISPDSRYVEFNKVLGASGYRITLDDGSYISEFFVDNVQGGTRQRVFFPENPSGSVDGEIQALNGCGLSNSVVFTDKPPSGNI